MRKAQLNSSGRWSKTKRLHFTVQSNKQTAQNTHTTQCKTYTLQCTTKQVSALTAHLLTKQPQDEVFGVWEWIDFRVEGFSRLRKKAYYARSGNDDCVEWLQHNQGFAGWNDAV